MTIEVQSLSAKELKALISSAQKQQDKLAKRPKAAAMRAKIDKYVRDHGYTIAELYGFDTGKKVTKDAGRHKSKAGKKLGKVPPKYRDPSDPNQTWTGRGRQPRWLTALVAKGKSPEDFLIK